MGSDSGESLDVETRDAQGQNAESQQNPNKPGVDLEKVTGEVRNLIATVESVANAL